MDELVSQAFSLLQPHLPLRGGSPACLWLRLWLLLRERATHPGQLGSGDLEIILESPIRVMAGPSLGN